jgi:hypothetical protein
MKGPRFNRKKCFSIKSQTPRRKQVRPVYELTENDSDGACLDDGRVARQRAERLGTFESFLDFWLAAALMSVKKLPDFVDRSFF